MIWKFLFIPLIAAIDDPYEYETSGDFSDSILEYEDRSRDVKRIDLISDDEDFISQEEASGDIELSTQNYIETEKPYKEYEEIENEFVDEIEVDEKNGGGLTETIIEETIIEESPSEVKEVFEEKIISIPVQEKEARNDEIQIEEVESEGSWIEGRHVMAGLIGGGAAGVLFATLLIILCIHRIKKKDEGSYSIAHQARTKLIA